MNDLAHFVLAYHDTPESLKAPPHSIEAEQSVLGSLLRDKQAWKVVSNLLTEADFYRPEHRTIFRFIKTLSDEGQPCDIVTLAEKLEHHNQLNSIGGHAYLGVMARNTPDVANIATYVQIVKERALLREIRTIGSNIASSVHDTNGHTVQTLLKKGYEQLLHLAERSTTYEQEPLIPVEDESENPYPVEALGHLLETVVWGTVEGTGVPLALAAQSALVAMTFAVQGLARVQVINNYIDDNSNLQSAVPIGNFFCTIAESGEGKGLMDDIFFAAHRDWDSKQCKQWQNEYEIYEIELAEYNNTSGKKDKDADNRPKCPRKRGNCVLESPTVENIQNGFLAGKASIIVNVEDGMRLLGDWAMNKDNSNKTMAEFMGLWNRGSGSRERAKVEFNYEKRAFSLHIAIQPFQAMKFLVNNQDMTNIGFFSRMLFVFPNSTIGKRPFKKFSPHALKAHGDFRRQVTHLLALSESGINDKGELNVRTLTLTPDAEYVYLKFYDEIQPELGNKKNKAEYYEIQGIPNPSSDTEGKYRHIKNFANKITLQAVKLAAVLQLFEHSDSIAIDAEYLERGVILARYYLGEALRLFDKSVVSEEEANAQLLLEWLKNPLIEPEISRQVFKLREIQRSGPGRLRHRRILLETLKTLQTHGYGEIIPSGRSFHFKLFS